MTRPTEEVSTFTQMAQDMRDNGSKILNTALEKKLGLTVPHIKVTTDKDRNTEKDNSRGQTIASTPATSKTTI